MFGEIVSDVEQYLKELEAVKNFHVSIDETNRTSTWHVRHTIVIRVWVNKDLWESQLVMEKLTEDYSFEGKITKLCQGIYVPRYDIYYE